MYKLICVLILLKILDQTQSYVNNVMEGTNTKVKINQRVIDDFQVEIPEHFEQIGAKYYHIRENETVNWFGAAQKCRQIDGHLVNLQNEVELYNLGLGLNSSLEYWTDLNNLVKMTTFYSLTTGTKANMLNAEENNKERKQNSFINMCGYLKFDNSTSNFVLGIKSCVKERAYFICETTVPSTISFVLF